MTRRIAFLSQDSMDGYVCDDDLAVPAFAAAGMTVETVSWRSDADWSCFDLVIIRSPWDYTEAPEAFLAVLRRIADATRLENPVDLVAWNLDKRYLGSLAGRGVPIVPTEFGTALDAASLERLCALHPEGAIIKPVISAGARDTFRVPAAPDSGTRARVLAAHGETDFMWQPFVDSVLTEGEYSLFYFAGHYSHCIVKRPRRGDFRVQEEHGGEIVPVAPDAAQRAACDVVLAELDAAPLYARVDLVRGDDGRWWLIELELIEPSLYLRTDADSPARFAAATRDWLSG